MMDAGKDRTDHLLETLEYWGAAARSNGVNGYLVIDGSWQEDLVKAVRAQPHGWEPLFGQPNLPREETHIRSPLIIDIAQRPELLQPWLEDGFPRRLGIVVYSKYTLERMRTRLKRFQSVMIPDHAEPAFFRYFDGRTLSCFFASGFPEQWADFLNGIDTIAAPTDLSHGWTLFQLSGETLRRGIESQPGEDYTWEDIQPNPADSEYQAGYPFRRIATSQYEKLTTCVEHGFYMEIALFIKAAFPDRTEQDGRDQVFEKVKVAADIARSEGHSEESEIYYWAVLSYLVGNSFYKEPRINAFLAQQHLDMAGKLEMLLEQLNKSFQSTHLLDLIDTEETHCEFADGSTYAYRRRSGKVLTN